MSIKTNTSGTEFYKEYYDMFSFAAEKAHDLITTECAENIEHVKIRIKSEESVKAKLKKLGAKPSMEEALFHLTDIVGLRIVCRFLTDVYAVAAAIERHAEFRHIVSKDYIKNPKENGYRSYHIIFQIATNEVCFPIEVQLRTISQDSWASLEHKMKYKKEVSNGSMIKGELKRLADEMASADVCMQTLKEVIDNFEAH